MHQAKRLRVATSILVCFLLQARGADKYTDENRPYEFGFKIDGQQHRHESKDKDGIIMGEFGFVTADDVYHVTVYATDKEGRFKILSMKNIHLKSSSQSSPRPATSARQGHSLALSPASVNSPQIPTVLQAPAPSSATIPPSVKKISIEPPGRSCSSCSIPTTTTRAPPPLPAAGNNNYNTPTQSGGVNYPPGQQNYPQPGQGTPQSYLGGAQTYPGPSVNLEVPYAPGSPNTYAQQPSPSVPNYPGAPGNNQVPNAPSNPNTYAQQPGQTAQTYPSIPGSPNTFANPDILGAAQPAGVPQTYQGGQSGVARGNNEPNVGSAVPDDYAPGVSSRDGQSPQGVAGGRTSKQFKGTEQELPSIAGPNSPKSLKPTLISAQMQIVDKNTDINSLRPGEQKGLPPGIHENDMTQLLYTFNYTVGFHGHFEEGYTNGVKKGYYFVTGRSGVRTRIDYIADDTGFHPTITQEVLDLLSDDVPKEETEKDAKYGLKGYEFKWLYYPVESRKR